MSKSLVSTIPPPRRWFGAGRVAKIRFFSELCSMICYPHVKINLGLHVLRRREDGFHDLETLFVPSDQFHDTLEIIAGDDYSRTLKGLEERYAPLGTLTFCHRVLLSYRQRLQASLILFEHLHQTTVK